MLRRAQINILLAVFGCDLAHGLGIRGRCFGSSMKLSDDGVLGVGVIGAGRIGMVHLEALSSCENARAVIISNPTVAKAQAAAARYRLDGFTADYEEVINHPEVEAVWICSPSAFHADQIKACAAAGKHVFCEKPIAVSTEETIEAINACSAAGVQLMTALQRRFDHNFQRVKSAIAHDEVGEVVTIKLCSRDPAPPPFEYVKGGGGIFKDMAIRNSEGPRTLVYHRACSDCRPTFASLLRKTISTWRASSWGASPSECSQWARAKSMPRSRLSREPKHSTRPPS